MRKLVLLLYQPEIGKSAMFADFILAIIYLTNQIHFAIVLSWTRKRNRFYWRFSR